MLAGHILLTSTICVVLPVASTECDSGRYVIVDVYVCLEVLQPQAWLLSQANFRDVGQIGSKGKSQKSASSTQLQYAYVLPGQTNVMLHPLEELAGRSGSLPDRPTSCMASNIGISLRKNAALP